MPSGTAENKYRAAIDVLMSGRDVLVGSLADDILAQAEDLVDGGYQFNEFLETQGTRLHFLGLMIAQLEQSADTFDEAQLPPPPRRPPDSQEAEAASEEADHSASLDRVEPRRPLIATCPVRSSAGDRDRHDERFDASADDRFTGWFAFDRAKPGEQEDNQTRLITQGTRKTRPG